MFAFALLQQGCGATWSVDFTTASGIDDWKRVDWFAPWEGELDGANGLYMDGKVFVSPLGFDGNFAMEVVFSIDTLGTVESIYFLFNMGHPALSEWIQYAFYDVGNPVNERFSVSENQPYEVLDMATQDLGIRMDGTNLFKLVKTGKNLKAYLNGKNFSSCTYTSYDYDVLFPNFSVDQADGEHYVHIRSINVKFQDSVYSNPY
jgi:hypothetical protein